MTNNFEDDFDLNQEDCTLQDDSGTGEQRNSIDESAPAESIEIATDEVADAENGNEDIAETQNDRLVCPSCKESDFNFYQRINAVAEHPCAGWIRDGELRVAENFNGLEDVEDLGDPWLICRKCGHKIEIPWEAHGGCVQTCEYNDDEEAESA